MHDRKLAYLSHFKQNTIGLLHFHNNCFKVAYVNINGDIKYFSIVACVITDDDECLTIKAIISLYRILVIYV